MPISSLPGANSPPPEHKNSIFVLFWPSEPLFLGVSSTKLGFLCFFGLWNPCFRAFRAQNWGFCALLPSGTLVFGRFEHKIEVFVRFCRRVVAHLRETLTERRYTYRARGQRYGAGARNEGTMPELRARCQRCGGVGRNKKAPAVPEPSMYVCCVRVIVVEYVSTRTCDVYTFLYTFPYARTLYFAHLHFYTCTPVRLYVYASGDGGTRTLVQQNHPKVFYMLSSYLIVGR